MLTIIVKSVFEEDDKFYLQLFRRVFVWIIKMLQYQNINVSEGINTDKKKCIKIMYALSLLVL